MNLAAIFFAAATASAPVITASDSVCHINGYNADKDMTGTNIRSAPDASAPVIFRLMPEKEPDDTYGSEFEVIGSKKRLGVVRHGRVGGVGGGNPKDLVERP